MNRLTTWLTGTKPNWDRICVSKYTLLIHHISHKSQWTKPLNESTVSKTHIGTATESYLQRSSFDSVHFIEFYFFFFADSRGWCRTIVELLCHRPPILDQYFVIRRMAFGFHPSSKVLSFFFCQCFLIEDRILSKIEESTGKLEYNRYWNLFLCLCTLT